MLSQASINRDLKNGYSMAATTEHACGIGQIEAATTAYNNAYNAAFASWISDGKTPGKWSESNSETNP